ncbi:MAG: DUF2589 domain-containing protein [Rhodothermaceae bacterium]
MPSNDSHNFYELLGAPLIAFIQAEYQAAQTTLEFIEKFGFTDPSSDSDDMGRLRMATFRQNKRIGNGTYEENDVKIPLLSLVPIPMMQVKDAELEFYLKVTDFLSESVQNDASGVQKENTGETGDTDSSDQSNYLSSNRLQMKTAMSNAPGSSGSKQNSEMQMKVKLKLEPADLPTGISHLLELMDDGVIVEKAKGSPASMVVKICKTTEDDEIKGNTLSTFGLNTAPQILIKVSIRDEEGSSVKDGTPVKCFISGTKAELSAGEQKLKANQTKTVNGTASFRITGAESGEEISITLSCGALDNYNRKLKIVH